MKLLRKNKIYVQIEDLIFLIKENYEMPKRIQKKIIELSQTINSNQNDFIKFEENYEVSYFLKIEAILNLEDYVDLTKLQIYKELKRLLKAKENWSCLYKIKGQNTKQQVETCQKELTIINHKILAIYDLIDYKENTIEVNIPDAKIQRKLAK